MPVLAWGYADGGRAVAAAGELHPEYAPELDLRGICAGAVASDLAALAPTLSKGMYGALALAGLIGLARAYPQLPLRDVLTEEGLRVAEEAAVLPRAQLLDGYREHLSAWCRRPDPWNDPLWRRVLASETLAHTAPVMPMHLYHGTDDRIVPVHAGRRTLLAYRQRGAHVSWREYDTDHTATAVDAVAEAIARLGEDLDRPATLGRVLDNPGRAARA
jgi:pimeloyl-ACP methyl ester carboxylesterase